MNADLLAQGWKAHRDAGGFEQHIGPLYARKVEGGLRFGFRAEPQHANNRGVIHGGMLMSFADHILGALVWYTVGKKPCATASLNCDFVSAARVGDWVEGQAELTRKGRSLVFVRGDLFVADRVVLSANGIWKVLGAE